MGTECEAGYVMHVVILERNKLVGRKVARLFMATGATAVAIEDPAAVPAVLDGADVLCADTFDGDLVAEQAPRAARAARRPVDRRAAEALAALPGRDRRDRPRARPPRLRVAAARVGAHDDRAPARRATAAPPLGGVPRLGVLGARARGPRDRGSRRRGRPDPGLRRRARRCRKRVAEMFGELGHELIMNAMYDAPVDAYGRAEVRRRSQGRHRARRPRAARGADRDRRHAARAAGPRSVRPARAPPRLRRAARAASPAARWIARTAAPASA